MGTTTEHEVMVINADTGRPVIDLDPINVTVIEEIPAIEYRLADGRDERLMDIWEAAEEAAQDVADALTYALVWSDTRRVVKAACVACDDPFAAEELMISDGGLVCIPCFEEEEA